MESSTRFLFAEDQIANNPSVDHAKINEAERARRELENLGVWKKTESRVRNPFGMKPNISPHGQKIAWLIAQSD